MRVKKAIGIRCTLANSERRRSKMRPSPTRALHHRCTIARPASATAAATAIDARITIWRLSPWGIAVSMIALNTNGATRASIAAAKIDARNERDRLLVGPGERPDAAQRAVLQLDALHGVAVVAHHRMWRHSHAVTLRARDGESDVNVCAPSRPNGPYAWCGCRRRGTEPDGRSGGRWSAVAARRRCVVERLQDHPRGGHAAAGDP